MDRFAAIPPDDLNLRPWNDLIYQSMVGIGMAGFSLAGLANSLAALENSFPHLVREMELELHAQIQSGRTILSAAGVTGVFDGRPGDAAGTIGSPQWAMTSAVSFGWRPSPESGGSLVNQFQFRDVYAARPFGMAVRPDGRRAVVSFFQTGNFGVLDLDHQTLFPSGQGQLDTVFKGVVAVTPALRLDNHLWPRRGAYSWRSGSTTSAVPSPDESLLYPGPIQYAQNGRFAVGVHTGSKPPTSIGALLPDFASENDARLSLNSIGFNVAPGAVGGTDPDGVAITSLQPYTFRRGGGAVTVLHDDLITADLTTGVFNTAPGLNGNPRPYYSRNPLCQDADPDLPLCASDVFTRHFTYERADGTRGEFSRPRGVAIQPFVTFEAPLFGDYVRDGTSVRVRWRDLRVQRVRFELHDLGTAAAPLATPSLVNARQRDVTQRERTAFSARSTFRALFGSEQPADGHRYRITATISTDSGEEISSVSIDVVYER